MIDQKILEEKELEILESGKWGTISPYSMSAGKALADLVGASYGLLCFSYDAVYAAILRSFQVAHGDYVITGEVSTPVNSIVAASTGATPLFTPVCSTCGMLRLDAVEAFLATYESICCVVLDYLPEQGDNYPLDKLAALCRSHNVPLVINAGGSFSASHKGKPLCDYAAAVFYSLEEGSEVYAGKGGFTAVNDSALYSDIYAYHNCGRPFNAGSSLNMDDKVGGNLRVTEWTAVIAQLIVESKEFSHPAPRRLVPMAAQPVFAKE